MAEDREQRNEGRQLFCRVITPEEVIYDGEADLVIARIADGDLGVLVDHSPLVSTVEVGEVRIREGEKQLVYATSDGFFKVSENLVQVLVEEAGGRFSDFNGQPTIHGGTAFASNGYLHDVALGLLRG